MNSIRWTINLYWHFHYRKISCSGTNRQSTVCGSFGAIFSSSKFSQNTLIHHHFHPQLHLTLGTNCLVIFHSFQLSRLFRKHSKHLFFVQAYHGCITSAVLNHNIITSQPGTAVLCNSSLKHIGAFTNATLQTDFFRREETFVCRMLLLSPPRMGLIRHHTILEK